MTRATFVVSDLPPRINKARDNVLRVAERLRTNVQCLALIRLSWNTSCRAHIEYADGLVIDWKFLFRLKSSQQFLLGCLITLCLRFAAVLTRDASMRDAPCCAAYILK